MRKTLVVFVAMLLITMTARLANSTPAFEIGDSGALTFDNRSHRPTVSVDNTGTILKVTAGWASMPFSMFIVTGSAASINSHSAGADFIFTLPGGATSGGKGSRYVDYHNFLAWSWDYRDLTWADHTNSNIVGNYARYTFEYGNGREPAWNLYDSFPLLRDPYATFGTVTAYAPVTNIKDPVATPEPASLLLVAGVLLACGLIRRQRRMARRRPFL